MMLRRNIAFLALCCWGQAAWADVDSEELSNQIFEKDKHVLKEVYRHCSENRDCTYVAGVCDGYLAVNNALQGTIDGKIQDLATTVDCPVTRGSGPAPNVACVEGRCKIIAPPRH